MDSGGKRVKQAGAAEPVRIVGMKGEISVVCTPAYCWLCSLIFLRLLAVLPSNSKRNFLCSPLFVVVLLLFDTSESGLLKTGHELLAWPLHTTPHLLHGGFFISLSVLDYPFISV